MSEGIVYDSGGVKVTAFKVNHGELIDPAYGYRIEFDGRTVVLSGDTKYNENLVKNAEGADSPQTAQDALSAQALRWIVGAGLTAPAVAEVGPLFALDEADFGRNLTASDFGPVFDRA